MRDMMMKTLLLEQQLQQLEAQKMYEELNGGKPEITKEQILKTQISLRDEALKYLITFIKDLSDYQYGTAYDISYMLELFITSTLSCGITRQNEMDDLVHAMDSFLEWEDWYDQLMNGEVKVECEKKNGEI